MSQGPCAVHVCCTVDYQMNGYLVVKWGSMTSVQYYTNGMSSVTISGLGGFCVPFTHCPATMLHTDGAYNAI